MTSEEFRPIAQQMKAAYATKQFLENMLQFNTWFNMLLRYDAADVSLAVNQYIEENRVPPVPNDIISRTKEIVRAKEKKSKFDYFGGQKLVRCNKCQDRGYKGIKEYPNGAEYIIVCDCKAARTNFPWLCMTKEEKDLWYENEERHGRHPERPYEETHKMDWEAINNHLNTPCKKYIDEHTPKKQKPKDESDLVRKLEEAGTIGTGFADLFALGKVRNENRI